MDTDTTDQIALLYISVYLCGSVVSSLYVFIRRSKFYPNGPNRAGQFLWLFLPVGYLVTILIETPVLIFGLSPKLTLKQKLLCGIWLTACTYPIVVLVLPTLMLDYFNTSRELYLAVAETFAPAGECLFFWFAFRGKEPARKRRLGTLFCSYRHRQPRVISYRRSAELLQLVRAVQLAISQGWRG